MFMSLLLSLTSILSPVAANRCPWGPPAPPASPWWWPTPPTSPWWWPTPPSRRRPTPPPPPPKLSSRNFYRCLNEHSPISFSTVYAPDIDRAAFDRQLSSTAQNLRCLVPSVPKPLLIFAPNDESHVSAAVNCSHRLGANLRVRSGGHDYEGLSYVSLMKKPFIILDLQNLRDFTYEPRTQTAWVQAGVTTGEFYYRVANATGGAYGFPAGLCMSLGIGGHITGGAYGALMRKFGLGIDSAIDARIVMADGTVVASVAHSDPDLFWALKGGGGGNFGIILAWRLKLVQVPGKVTGITAARVLDNNGIKTLDKWQKKAYRIDRNLFIRVLIQRSGPNGPVLAIYNGIFLGTVDKLVSNMMKSLPELKLNGSTECREMSWIESMVYIGGYANGKPIDLLDRKPAFLNSFKAKSDFTRGLITMKGLEALRDLHNTGDFSLLTIMNPLGGRVAEVEEYETAYVHRGAAYMIQYVTTTLNTSLETTAKIHEFMTKVYDTMTSYIPTSDGTRESYVNYKDLDLGLTDFCPSNCSCPESWGHAYYKRNFERLVMVKTRVDPYNFFLFEQSIPSWYNQGECLKFS
ncbi:FAD-binding Berberine family protein [Striga hermonthica]|uniref:FAD-binding Berberine family protein n=1 Tax=Striga hermonthica TaxID=68872 RepID=A0A9N7NBU8_STRHE|nr:FAD-binding Berberine family protein [Striga hermonthica]